MPYSCSSSLAKDILVLIKLAVTDKVVIFSVGVVMEKQTVSYTVLGVN